MRVRNELEKEKEGQIEIGVRYVCGGKKKKTREKRKEKKKKRMDEIKFGKIILKIRNEN